MNITKEIIKKLEVMKEKYLKLILDYQENSEKRRFWETIFEMENLIGEQTQHSFNKGVLIFIERELQLWNQKLKEEEELIKKYEDKEAGCILEYEEEILLREIISDLKGDK